MAKIAFTALVQLKNAVRDVDNNWELTLGFTDRESMYGVGDINVNDVLVFDTGAVALGTVSQFQISDVIETTRMGDIRVTAIFLGPEDIPSPELTWLVGGEGLITRPEFSTDIVPLPSPDAQITSDRLSFHTLNHNLKRIAQNLTDAQDKLGVITVKLPFQGSVYTLPSKSYGGLIHNLVILHMADSSIVELIDIYVDNDNTISLPEEDLSPFEGEITDVMVSYIGDSEQAYTNIETVITDPYPSLVLNR